MHNRPSMVIQVNLRKNWKDMKKGIWNLYLMCWLIITRWRKMLQKQKLTRIKWKNWESDLGVDIITESRHICRLFYFYVLKCWESSWRDFEGCAPPKIKAPSRDIGAVSIINLIEGNNKYTVYFFRAGLKYVSTKRSCLRVINIRWVNGLRDGLNIFYF